MQLRSPRRTFSGTQLKFWIGLILHMLHYKMACIHSLFGVTTERLRPTAMQSCCCRFSGIVWKHAFCTRKHDISIQLRGPALLYSASPAHVIAFFFFFFTYVIKNPRNFSPIGCPTFDVVSACRRWAKHAIFTPGHFRPFYLCDR